MASPFYGEVMPNSSGGDYEIIRENDVGKIFYGCNGCDPFNSFWLRLRLMANVILSF